MRKDLVSCLLFKGEDYFQHVLKYYVFPVTQSRGGQTFCTEGHIWKIAVEGRALILKKENLFSVLIIQKSNWFLDLYKNNKFLESFG